MKKLLILNCFCMLLLFITCKQDLSPINYIENEELSDIEKSELIPETRLNFDLFFDWYPL